MEYQRRYNTLHRSLNEVQTIAGVERKLAIGNGTLTAAFFMGTKMLPFILLGMCSHYFLRYITANDHLIIKAYMRWAKQGYVYDPWHRVSQKKNARPNGFGRGNLN